MSRDLHLQLPCAPGRDVRRRIVAAVAMASLVGVLAFAAASPAEAAPQTAAGSADAPTAVQAAVPTHGSPFELPFPRLSMWWPDTDTASIASMARYDWIALGPWDDPEVATRIHALHPDELVLNATNACETDFNPDKSAGSSDNESFAPIPTDWLLTQVGSTLTSAVSTSTTTFSVAAVRATSPEGERIDLFVVGDIIVIEGELARVTSVDVAAKKLTVKRGVVKPASKHSAGTRVAATIAFWPDSPMMDLTAACPSVTVDPSVGPETWAEYNARIGADLVLGTDFDGLLVDRSDGDESWLLGNSTARSIDMNRTNTIPADYTAFDEAWNAGLHGYELRLRGYLPTMPIYGNWAFPNYDIFNGNNFEGFPNERESDLPWGRTVLGPWDRVGSYFEWLAHAQQPNLTTIETYEDDGFTDPTGDGSYDNPYEHKGFRPDYRKMRFGLATALLGDGFFSYEINTNGHGSLGLMWFAEYDGNGRGRGFLGQPLEPSHRIAETPTGSDLLGGSGAFDTAAHASTWKLTHDDGVVGTSARETTPTHSGAGMMRVAVTKTKNKYWNIAEVHDAKVVKGTQYTLSFWARADRERAIATWIQEPHGAWRDWVLFGSQNLTTEWNRYVVSGTAVGTDAEARLHFGLGGTTGTVWIDDVVLQTGSPETWVREYDNGVAVVNATRTTTTANLGGLYRRLKSAQSPDVDTGHLAYRLKLGPKDGRILARVDAPQLASDMNTAAVAWADAESSARAAAAHFLASSKTGSAAHRRAAGRARTAWATVATKASSAETAARAARAALLTPATATPTAVKSAATSSLAARRAANAAAAKSSGVSSTAALAAARSADNRVQAIYTSGH